jgi:epoxyqueuosine reductase
MMTPEERTRWVWERARALGFDVCGVAPAQRFAELDQLRTWLDRGFGGEMNYLHDSRRADPRLVLQGARSLIVAGLNYNSPHSYPAQSASGIGGEPPRGWISRYAWGDDYHEVVKRKLDVLLGAMHAEFDESFEARAYVDTGPIVERVAAKYAGLGWLAKNTCLINQQLGSWLFLGVIITTLAIEPTLAPDATPPPDLCGSCTRCLDACPTKAFPEPYVLDARRCISYLTIELRGAIPQELRPEMGSAVVGCDICQDVCPWNRKAPVTSAPAFQPRHVVSSGERPDGREPNRPVDSLLAPELEWLASLSQKEFSAIFRNSAVKRSKWRGVVRNACIALGNSGLAPGSGSYLRVVQLLRRLASSEDALIVDHAAWALAKLGASEDRPAGSQSPIP